MKYVANFAAKFHPLKYHITKTIFRTHHDLNILATNPNSLSLHPKFDLSNLTRIQDRIFKNHIPDRVKREQENQANKWG